MVGSFKKIDYRMRPAKHAERSMLIDLYKRLRFRDIEEYQYVGFGSVAFVDFRMVHRSLGLTKLISIENVTEEDDKKRFIRNKPYGSLDLRFGNSSQILPTIDFSTPSLVWLDYDQPLRRSMANDLDIILRRAASGTFIALTFTCQFPVEVKESEKALKWLREAFPQYVSEDAKTIDFTRNKYGKFARSTLNSLIEQSLNNADAGIQDPMRKRRAEQICFITYRDGLKMATIGWVIVSGADDAKFNACAFNGLPFYSPDEDSFDIKIPLVTPLEVREMEHFLPTPHTESELNWIPQQERNAFVNGYRYLPNFAPIEPV